MNDREGVPVKTMAEVLAEHQYNPEGAVCSCSNLVQVGLRCDTQTHPQHVAAALSAAGFGDVREQKARLDMLTMACEEAEECGRETISIKGLRATLTVSQPGTGS
jgi:hypothetical protein